MVFKPDKKREQASGTAHNNETKRRKKNGRRRWAHIKSAQPNLRQLNVIVITAGDGLVNATTILDISFSNNFAFFRCTALVCLEVYFFG